MAAGEQSRSQEGFQWTAEGGLQPNLPTTAVVSPASSLLAGSDDLYDAIIIGAGYAGLTAARDLTLSGAKVRLLEARDRIGGRTWTATVDGHKFEMGGSYVHWSQPNLWHEVARYQMHGHIYPTADLEKGVTSCSLISPSEAKTISQDEQAVIVASAFSKFANVDGTESKTVMLFPQDPLFNPKAAQLDELSIADRIDQIRGDLTADELTYLEGFLGTLSGSKLEDAGLFNQLRVWALCGYSAEGLMAVCASFTLRDGQSAFAQRFFDEALGTKRLKYSFSCPVASITDRGKEVSVRTVAGHSFRAQRVICTVPHNVLDTITFEPPLEHAQKDVVVGTQNVNHITKLHAEVQPAGLRTWDGVVYPHNKLVHSAGEAVTPAGNAHLVCFGAEHDPLRPAKDIDGTLAAVKNFDSNIQVKRLVFHDWNEDPYSRGGWSTLPPSMCTTRDIGILREARGNVHLANADWAVGRRGFIDGAIEEGTRAAKAVRESLAS